MTPIEAIRAERDRLWRECQALSGKLEGLEIAIRIVEQQERDELIPKQQPPAPPVASQPASHPPTPPDLLPRCSEALKIAGKPYARTCVICKLGPCRNPALPAIRALDE